MNVDVFKLTREALPVFPPPTSLLLDDDFETIADDIKPPEALLFIITYQSCASCSAVSSFVARAVVPLFIAVVAFAEPVYLLPSITAIYVGDVEFILSFET